MENDPADVKGAEKGNNDFIQFAYTAAHDLKSPLNNITGFIRVLEDDLKGHIEPVVAHDLLQIKTAAKRMVALIDDLLMYAKAGSGELFIQEVNMEDALQTALLNLHTVIEESHAVIVHDPLPTLLCDGTHMICLLQNLIENAIKFRGDKVPHIEVRSEMRGNEVVFSVRDNGIGIEPRYHGKIFEVFERLHSQSEYPGTGIGLAVCKNLVERHKGRIEVTSQLGEGTTFAFTLQKG